MTHQPTVMDVMDVASPPVAPKLPDNHPVEWLGDSKRFYKNCLPPFVHKGIHGLRKRVVVARWQDQYRSSSEVVNRRWDRWYMMTTIDLNGNRYIVRAFGCAGGGFRFHCWDGSIRDFGTYAVAYSWPREVADRSESLKETYKAGSGLPNIENVEESHARSPRQPSSLVDYITKDGGSQHERHVQHTMSTPCAASSASDNVQSKDNKQNSSLDLSPRSFSVSRLPNVEILPPADRIRRTSPTTFIDPWKPSTSITTPTATLSPQARASNVLAPRSGPPEAEEHDQVIDMQQSKKRPGSEAWPAELSSSEANYKRARHDGDHLEYENFGNTTHEDTPPIYPSPRRSLGSRDLERSASASARQAVLIDNTDLPLSHIKQRHTTLRVMLPLSADFVPLRLSSCMNMPSLFELALAISGSKNEDLQISGLRMTFDWKAEGDVDRAMLLKQEYPESFEIFLDLVNQAPCWRNDGARCSVGVEVVLI